MSSETERDASEVDSLGWWIDELEYAVLGATRAYSDRAIKRVASAKAAIRARAAHPAEPPFNEPIQSATQNAMSDFELTRSIIHGCPALRLPQSFVDRLGMTAQIVALKGATPEIAQYVVDACNRAVASDVADPLRTVTGDGAGELPELPAPIHYEHREPRERYTADQMRAYARAAVAQALKGQAAKPGAAALTDERLLRQAMDALENHRDQTRPIEQTDVAIAELRARLGASQP